MERIFRPKIFSVIEQNYLKDLFTKDLFAPVISIVALSLAVALAVVLAFRPKRDLQQQWEQVSSYRLWVAAAFKLVGQMVLSSS